MDRFIAIQSSDKVKEVTSLKSNMDRFIDKDEQPLLLYLQVV